MSVHFRKAGTSDALVLNAISKQAFESDVEVGAPSVGGPPGYMSLKYHMKMARSGHLFKLTDDGLIVGGAVLFPDGDTLNIGRIFVNPDHYRKGYGIRMMQEIEALFPEIMTYTLDTPVWNNRTNSFYRKLGYTEAKRNDEFVYYYKHRIDMTIIEYVTDEFECCSREDEVPDEEDIGNTAYCLIHDIPYGGFGGT